MDAEAKAEIDRLCELANVGAGHAAGAFAQLVGQTIRTAPPVVRAARGGAAGPDDADWSTGVFFEFEGCLHALVGILFPAAASEALVRRVVGLESGELAPAVIESALMEVGNILASHVASAIADTLGSRLLPSIPSLAMQDAEGDFATRVEAAIGPDAPCIESLFSDAAGLLRGRLVLVPTRGAAAPAAGEERPNL